MSGLWTEEARYERWLKVELAACEALAEAGVVPQKAADTIRRKAKVNSARVEEIEKSTRHDVAAFVQAVGETIGDEASRWFHYGMTSSDVLDTALALALVEAADIILDDLEKLWKVIARLANKHRDTPMTGRSHGVHAEPLTFGVVLASWLSEIGRCARRMKRAREEIGYGKLSGVVGVYGNIPPKAEVSAMKKLGLKPEPVSTQVVPRDRHAEYFSAIAVTGTAVERIALEIRHLHRTEVREVEEGFAKGQKGSSAMPHKRNPVGAENLTGCARLLRANAGAAMENVALWHQRDISHSSVERIIAPDSTILLDYMLARLTDILENLAIYPENMKRNLKLTRGLIYSEAVLLKLAEKGLSRDEAYAVVQKNAMRTWDNPHTDFRRELEKDEEAKKLLTAEDLDECFSLERHLEHAGQIVERVIEQTSGKPKKSSGKGEKK